MKFFHQKKIRFILLETLFFILSFSLFFSIFYTNLIPFNSDAIFHIKRAYDLVNDLKNFKIPLYSMYVGDPSGLATPSAYPYIAILPISLLVLYHVPMVLSCVIDLTLFTFIGFNTGYFACKQYTHNPKIALLFVIFYNISTISLGNSYYHFAISAYVALLFAPLALFGYFSWIKHNHWKMMTIGLLIMNLSHLLSVFVFVLLFTVLTCFYYKKLNKNRLLTLVKAILIYGLCTSIIWIPLIVLSLKNHLVMTILIKHFNFNKSGTLFPSLITLLTPQNLSSWTYTDIVALVLGLIYWKRLKWDARKLYMVSLIFLLLMLNKNPIFTPTDLLAHTFLVRMQIIDRVATDSHILLSYLLAFIIVKILAKRWHIQNLVSFLTIIFLIMCSTTALAETESVYYMGIKAMNISTFNRLLDEHKIHSSIIKLNNSDLSLPLIKKSKLLSSSSIFDYAPYISRVYELHGNARFTHQKMYLYRNKMRVTHISSRKMLPIIMYRGQSYTVKINGKRVHWNRKYDFLHMPSLRKSSVTVQVNPALMWYRYVSYVLALIGLFCLCKSKR